MAPNTSIVLYQKEIKMKQQIQKILNELRPHLISIEINNDIFCFQLKALIPINWKLKKDEHIIIEKYSQTNNANSLLIKPINIDTTIDYLLTYLKDNINTNIKRENIEKKIEEKRIKEQQLLEEKLEKIKNNSLKIKDNDEFIEFENTTPLIINNEPINEEEEFAGIDASEFLKSFKNKEFVEQPQFIQIEPDDDGLSDEEYYGMRPANILPNDNDYFKSNNNQSTRNSEFSKIGLDFHIERETE
jgi:hypothetical protein